jgi:hypothetical protein
MIKIEFPADRTDIALAMSKALADIAGCPVVQTTGHSRYGAVSARTAIEDPNLAAMMEITPVEFPNIVDEDEADRLESLATGLEEESMAALEDACIEEVNKSTGVVDIRLDEKGVPFNKELCANATKPFYASGKERGQWKRRPGVDQGIYDAWYAEALGLVPAATTEPEPEPTIDVQEAVTPTATKVPTNGGEFFAWVSEMQTAGHITQADLDAAYPAAGVDPQGVWTQPVEVQKQMFAAVHSILSAKASV